jgi:O-acetylhomoserine/O-acetylserine sulfhydrylase-like pyridoxal-dependent enzyme
MPLELRTIYLTVASIYYPTVYGCTHSLMMKLQKQYGIHVHFADTTNLDAIATLLEEHGTLVARELLGKSTMTSHTLFKPYLDSSNTQHSEQ